MRQLILPSGAKKKGSGSGDFKGEKAVHGKVKRDVCYRKVTLSFREVSGSISFCLVRAVFLAQAPFVGSFRQLTGEGRSFS